MDGAGALDNADEDEDAAILGGLSKLTAYYGDQVTGRYQVTVDDPRSDCQVTKTTPSQSRSDWLHRWFSDLFLPEGYPESVSDDYLQYQIWDTVQAYASSITGSLATQAVLQGMGVGDPQASVLASTVTWLLKDGTSMVGRIVFAWRCSDGLDALCKQWRLFADVLNDVAICTELAAPMFGPALFKVAVVASGVAKSVVGVAGGATRAGLTQHQARWNNLADVSAKDGSQETLVNLAALITSLLLLPLLPSGSALCWLTFLLFTLLHVFANYRAVKSVRMDTLNQPRFFIAIRRVLQTHSAACSGQHPSAPVNASATDLSVASVNTLESVLLGVRESTWAQVSPGVKLRFGVSVDDALDRISPRDLAAVLRVYSGRRYALFVHRQRREVLVLLRTGATAECQLRALTTAVACAAAHLVPHGNKVSEFLRERLQKYEEERVSSEDRHILPGDIRLASKAVMRLGEEIFEGMSGRMAWFGWDLTTVQLQSGQHRFDM